MFFFLVVVCKYVYLPSLMYPIDSVCKFSTGVNTIKKKNTHTDTHTHIECQVMCIIAFLYQI